MIPVVCITGGSKGIGKALADIYAQKGYRLLLASRGEKKGTETLQKQFLAQGAAEIISISCDFSANGAEKLTHFLQSNKIIPDIAIINAGVGAYGSFIDIPLSKDVEMIGVNIRALTELSKWFSVEMSKRKSGQILLTASTAAFQPGPNMATYFATKSFVLSLGLSLREELAAHGVTVSVLCPGPTKTNFSSTANAERTSIFNNKHTDTAEHVARIAVKGIAAQKAIIIPGTKNKLLAFLTRLIPKTTAAKIVFRSLTTHQR